jgi:hypothetical protein
VAGAVAFGGVGIGDAVGKTHKPVRKSKSNGAITMGCLRAARLNHARVGREVGTWVANAGKTKLTDLNAVVIVDGPYKSAKAAHTAAKSLVGTELAASGGRWEVTASRPSHLSRDVNRVAKCLANSAKSYSF